MGNSAHLTLENSTEHCDSTVGRHVRSAVAHTIPGTHEGLPVEASKCVDHKATRDLSVIESVYGDAQAT